MQTHFFLTSHLVIKSATVCACIMSMWSNTCTSIILSSAPVSCPYLPTLTSHQCGDPYPPPPRPFWNYAAGTTTITPPQSQAQYQCHAHWRNTYCVWIHIFCWNGHFCFWPLDRGKRNYLILRTTFWVVGSWIVGFVAGTLSIMPIADLAAAIAGVVASTRISV